MSNDKGPTYFGLVGHYVGCLSTLSESRKNLTGNASTKALTAVDDAIIAAAGAVVANIEMDKTSRSQ